MAALGARGKRGNAAPGQPDRGGPLSGKGGVRNPAVCLGCAGLHSASLGGGVYEHVRVDAFLGYKHDRIAH